MTAATPTYSKVMVCVSKRKSHRYTVWSPGFQNKDGFVFSWDVISEISGIIYNKATVLLLGNFHSNGNEATNLRI